MDSFEARRVLHQQLATYRDLPYSELASRIEKVETLNIARAAERPWQLEFQFHWDSEPGRDVRVTGSIDDGGIRAYFPVTDSFIKAPNGNFVGE